MPQSRVRTLPAFLAGLALVLVAPRCAFAQAWTPARGQGTFSLSYEYLNVAKHLFSSDVLNGVTLDNGTTVQGNEADLGHITAQTVLVNVEYGILDRLAANADVAFVQSKYDGVGAESSLDNGSYHGGFQDLTLSLRYMAIRNPVVVTPDIAVVIPTNDYATLGHTAVGTGLHEFHAGLSVGRVLWSFLPDGYIHGHAAFVWSEQVMHENLNREMADLEVGYYLTPGFLLRAFGDYSHTLGGIDWLYDINSQMTFEDHDAASRVTYRRVGGGLGVALGPFQTLFASVSTVVSGANTHKGTGYTIGTSRSLSGFGLPTRGRPTPQTQP